MATVVSLIQFVLDLRGMLEKKKGSILKLLKRIFGFKSEAKQTRPKNPDEKPNSSGNTAPKTNGRNGRDDYPGAKTQKVDHQCYKDGDTCPECGRAQLREGEPAVAYEWQGHAPLTLKVYLLQRFLCNWCRASFTASLPDEAQVKTVDDSDDEAADKSRRCNANAGANTIVAMMRYVYGVPNYRLATIQGRRGLPLPESTQWHMIHQVYLAGIHIFDRMIHHSAGGDLFKNDETPMAVSDLVLMLKASFSKAKRKSTRTSVILSRTSEATIVLYFTGTALAGENLAWILDHRDPDDPTPKLMCDASKNNLCGVNDEIIVGNCWDHLRRKFYELWERGDDRISQVLSWIGKVYVVDAIAKTQELSDLDRLQLHQKKSEPWVAKIKQWLDKAPEHVEENEALGDVVSYANRHWTEFTSFLRVAGMPLANIETEHAVRSPFARHRKASGRYKTEHGALVGDIIMSLAATCEKVGEDAHHYLCAIQENRSNVYQEPDAWMPWNYRQTLASTDPPQTV